MLLSFFTKTVVGSMFIMVIFLLGILPAFANTHTVTPLVMNFNLEKRDIVDETITLTNNSQRVVRVYASVNNVAMDGNGVIESFVQKSVADRTNTATTWIEISRQRIELQPGEVREVPFTIRMNPQTQPGTYNVFIGFAEGSNRPKAEAKVAQGNAPGTILTISVDQTQNQFLRLERFTVDTFITNREEGTFSYTVSNPSTVPVTPEGEIIFYDTSGQEVASQKLNTKKESIPAGEEKVFTYNVPSETLSIGKYKAFLSVEYGEFLTDSIQDTDYFYVLPLRTLILIFLLVLLVSILLALFVYFRMKPDGDLDAHGAEMVPLFIKDGTSPEQHHDIDLSKKNET